MDNNNLQAQPMPQPTPQPTPTVPPVVPPTPPESNKMAFWLILGLVVIALIVGGIYLFISRQQVTDTTTRTDISTQAPAQENLENELNAIEVADPAQDFTAVDQDLQNL